MVPHKVQEYLSTLGNASMYRLRPEYVLARLLAPFVTNSICDKDEGGELDNKGDLALDHIVASGSLPPGFPMTEIDGKLYWDGGLHSNTPLSEAINCLEKCDQNKETKRELIGDPPAPFV